LAVSAFLTWRFVFDIKDVDVEVDPPCIYPDGSSTAFLKVVPRNSLGFQTPFVRLGIKFEVDEGREKVDVTYSPDSSSIRLKAKYETGDVVVFIRTSRSIIPLRVVVPIVMPLTDSDGDGFPDVVELSSEEDSKNFRRWFVNIAESQFYRQDDAWREEDKDCAGLIRFSFRESLKKHDTEWLKKRNFLIDSNIPDVRKYHYPSVPLIGMRMFRSVRGPFKQTDLNQSDSVFANYVDAAHLKDHNLFF
jgi:hypothetical protein